MTIEDTILYTLASFTNREEEYGQADLHKSLQAHGLDSNDRIKFLKCVEAQFNSKFDSNIFMEANSPLELIDNIIDTFKKEGREMVYTHEGHHYSQPATGQGKP